MKSDTVRGLVCLKYAGRFLLNLVCVTPRRALKGGCIELFAFLRLAPSHAVMEASLFDEVVQAQGRESMSLVSKQNGHPEWVT